MKRIMILLLWGASLQQVNAQGKVSDQTRKNFDQLAWLCSDWQRTDMPEGKTSIEHWSKADDHHYKGYGVTMAEGDTLFYEKLQIVISEDKVYYVADVSHNREPVFFELVLTGDHSFVCDNPDHDFPKRISYSMKGQKLQATISGDGKKRDFFFVKKN